MINRLSSLSVVLATASYTSEILDDSNKLLLIGAIYALMRANTFMREILGGVSVDVSSNISSVMASFKT